MTIFKEFWFSFRRYLLLHWIELVLFVFYTRYITYTVLFQISRLLQLIANCNCARSLVLAITISSSCSCSPDIISYDYLVLKKWMIVIGDPRPKKTNNMGWPVAGTYLSCLYCMYLFRTQSIYICTRRHINITSYPQS